jgi:hypothetical protein
MVLAMSLLRMNYIATCLIVGVLTYFSLFPFVISLLLYNLLYLGIKAIPIQLAWERSFFVNLIWMHITTMVFSICIYAYLFFQAGLIRDGSLIDASPLESLYFSVTTWTTLGYGDFVAPSSHLYLTSMEAINGFVAMAIFIALIVVWINETITSLDERMEWIRSLTPEEVQKMRDELNPTQESDIEG